MQCFITAHNVAKITRGSDLPRQPSHYCDVIMGTVASQITSLAIVYSSVHSGTDLGKHQSSASLAFVRGIHRWPVNSPHKWPVTRNMFHFMTSSWYRSRELSNAYGEQFGGKWSCYNRTALYAYISYNHAISSKLYVMNFSMGKMMSSRKYQKSRITLWCHIQ